MKIFFKKLFFKIGSILTLMRPSLIFARKNVLRLENRSIVDLIDQNNISSIQDIGRYLRFSLKYFKDGILNHQQFVFETLKRGGGDCEDIHRIGQLLLIKILKRDDVYMAWAQVEPERFDHAFIVFKQSDGRWSGLNYNTYIKDKHSPKSVVLEIMSGYDVDRVYQVLYIDKNYKVHNNVS